jgi:hypothetical protein
VLEAAEVCRRVIDAVDPDSGEGAERAGAVELHAHVQERAAGHHVQLQEPCRHCRDGVPGADAERRRRVGREARH